jgi:hypothetical protein
MLSQEAFDFAKQNIYLFFLLLLSLNLGKVDEVDTFRL